MTLIDARHLSWPRVRTLADAGAIALLPVGSTEAHGPHLPLSVDVIIAEEVCRRVAARLSKDAVVFPAVAYALTDFAAPFAGTVSLNADVALAMLQGILRGMVNSGFRTIAVLNHHLEPAHFRVVHAAAKAVRASRPDVKIVVPDHRRPPTGPLLGHEFMHGGSHAGRYETSLMLAAAPQWVDEQLTRTLPTLDIDLPQVIKAGAKNFMECGGVDAYFGAPSEATVAEGERLFEVLAEAATLCIEETLLPQSAFVFERRGGFAALNQRVEINQGNVTVFSKGQKLKSFSLSEAEQAQWAALLNRAQSGTLPTEHDTAPKTSDTFEYRIYLGDAEAPQVQLRSVTMTNSDGTGWGDVMAYCERFLS